LQAVILAIDSMLYGRAQASFEQRLIQCIKKNRQVLNCLQAHFLPGDAFFGLTSLFNGFAIFGSFFALVFGSRLVGASLLFAPFLPALNLKCSLLYLMIQKEDINKFNKLH
jgi:hypothetical protein